MSLSRTKFRKKLKRRHGSLSSSNSNFNAQISSTKQEQEDPPFHPDLQLDTKLSSIYILSARRGHYTYYTKTNISSGVYYYETQITSLDYDIVSYIKSKCVDDVKKKYYEPLLNNIYNYLPTVRVGIVDANATLDIPVGATERSYCYRSKDGTIIKEGKYINGSTPCKTGDVIGCLVYLGNSNNNSNNMMNNYNHSHSHSKGNRKYVDVNVDEDEMNIDDSISNGECYMKFYVNGIEQSEKIVISKGCYKFAITVYNFAKATAFFGKEMKYVPSSSLSSSIHHHISHDINYITNEND